MYGRRCASIKMEPVYHCTRHWHYCLAVTAGSFTLWYIQGIDFELINRVELTTKTRPKILKINLKKPSFLVSLFAILTLISVNFADFITGLMTATHKTISETQTMISQQCGHSPAVLSVNITKIARLL